MFSCFWKVFCFTKLVKISKIVLPCFGDSVAGWSSCMLQLQVHTKIFRDSLIGQCPSRKKYLEYFSKFGILMFFAAQSGDLFAGGGSSRKGTQRFSWLPRDSFVGRTSNRKKHLENFSKILVSKSLTTYLGDLHAT